MLFGYILQSWSVNRDSERLSDSRFYSFLSSLGLLRSAQDLSGKKTNHDTDNAVHLGHGSSSQWSICTDTRDMGWEHQLLCHCHLGSPRSPLCWTPAALTLQSHLGLSIIHLSALLLNGFMFVYATGTQLWSISCEESAILSWCVCVFFYFFKPYSCQYFHLIQKERQSGRKLGFVLQWGVIVFRN